MLIVGEMNLNLYIGKRIPKAANIKDEVIMSKVYIGTWGKPENLKGYPLCHPRDTNVAIQRHRKMLYDLYIPNKIKLTVFDPYFIALDKIPKFQALEEIEKFKNKLLEFRKN